MNTHNLADVWAPERTQSGQFTKGSGGRPKGARAKASRQALETVKSFGPEALAALRESVLAKEQWAVLFVIGKILPANGRLVEFEGMSPDDVSAALKAGDISPAEAKDIATTLAKLAEIAEIEQLRDRLEELEKLLKGPKS